LIIGLKNLNHSGEGDFSQDNFLLNTSTNIDEFTFEINGIKYLNKVKTEFNMGISVNIPEMKFTVKNNELALNDFLLKFDGEISLKDQSTNIDLNFSSPRSKFKDIISLIPAIYKNDFSDIESSGNMEFNGKINGVLSDKSLPAFNFELNVNEGAFKYPNLPTPIQNVEMNLKINNNDGIVDNTIVDLSKLHLKLGEEPIEASLYMRNFGTGPDIKTKLKGKLNLGNVKKTLELNEIKKLDGTVDVDFSAQGNIATTNTNYEKINAKGKILFANIVYQGIESEEEINVNNAFLEFTPKNIKLNNFDAKLGKSDISANGYLNNLISYVLSDGILIGNLKLSSDFFDFNPYMSASEEANESNSYSETKTAAFDIPSNVKFSMESKFKKLLYDNLELTNVTGNINVQNSKVTLTKLNMNLLNGSLAGNGFYSKTELQENPDIMFNLSVKDFNIKQTYDKFLSVKQFAPIAKYINGSFSSNLKLNTSLDGNLEPVWESFFSNGLLDLKTAEIKGFKPFTTVGSILNLQELSNPKLKNVKPKFEVKNGRFYLSPVKYKVGNYDVVLSGSNGIDQSIDYTMEIDVPAGKLKENTNSAISGLLGKDINLVKSNSVKVKALIGGSIDSPKIKTSAADVVGNLAGSVIDEAKKQVVDVAKAKIDSAKIKAEQKLKEEAKKKEDELKKKLEEEAKKKLKKLFKFG